MWQDFKYELRKFHTHLFRKTGMIRDKRLTKNEVDILTAYWATQEAKILCLFRIFFYFKEGDMKNLCFRQIKNM